MIPAGRRRHHVVLQSMTATQNATTGVVTESWATFVECMGELRPLSVREYVAAGGKAAVITAMLLIPYVSGVKPSMRAVVDGRTTYTVEGVLPDAGSGTEHLSLPLSVMDNG